MTAGTTRDPATVGPYRLVRKLGEGGMGVVHLAVDPAGRQVALKVLRAHVASDDEARRRLTREVDTLRRVRHPQVAEVLDADVAGVEPYLVTRFVPGRSLEEEVRSTGPLPAGHVARVGRALAGALAAIHSVGVVHRDVKPANVMLVNGDPVLIDFGIAHIADESRITRTGLVMGTPGYLSPELIYGGAVTEATDWWAWGATLAFAATGRQPFGSGAIELVLERVRRGQSDLDGVEDGLRQLLAATLNVDPSLRPSTAALQSRLDGVISGVTTTSSAVDGNRWPTASPDDPTVRSGPAPVRPTTANPPVDRTARMPPVASRPAASPGVAAVPPYPGARPSRHQPPAVGPYPGGHPAPHGSPSNRQQLPPYGSPPERAGQYQNPPQYPQAQYPQAQYAQYQYPQAQYPQAQYPQAQYAQQGYPQAQYPQGQYAQPQNPQTPQHPQGQYPQGQYAQPQNPQAQDPSARVTGTLAAVVLALAAIGAVAPGGAIVMAFCLSALVRLVQRSSAGLQRRRAELGGPRATDVAVTVAALPGRLVMSLAMSVVTLLLPTLVAASTAFVVGAVASSGAISSDVAPSPNSAIALFAGMLSGSATAWWGPGGWSLRTGSRVVVRAVARGRSSQIVLVSLCVLVVVAAAMVAGQADYIPDWGPFPPPYSFVS